MIELMIFVDCQHTIYTRKTLQVKQLVLLKVNATKCDLRLFIAIYQRPLFLSFHFPRLAMFFSNSNISAVQ